MAFYDYAYERMLSFVGCGGWGETSEREHSAVGWACGADDAPRALLTCRFSTESAGCCVFSLTPSGGEVGQLLSLCCGPVLCGGCVVRAAHSVPGGAVLCVWPVAHLYGVTGE